MKPGPDAELEPALDRLLAAVDAARDEDPSTLESLFESLERVNELAATHALDPNRFTTVRAKLDLALARVSGVVSRLNDEKQRIGAELSEIRAARKELVRSGSRLDLTF